MSTTASNSAEETMVALIGSLADSKAGLGRAYADWAVSAPTLESAVAAAAMAQDELGHARSTYPVLKSFGVDEGGANRRLAILDEGLPDWSSFIAANLLVDGMMTTFVESCRNSRLAPLAQRAKKILQEERSHRIHGEAWARRLCRADEAQRELFKTRLEQTWSHASRWIGPDDDPGFASALSEGFLDKGPAAQREAVSNWATRLLAEGELEVELVGPLQWSGWEPGTRRWESG